ncbi:MAG: glycosyltransferase [Ilumatobacteraceae bacterium]
MSVAVVIVAAGRHGHLRRTLSALQRQARVPDEVIVVDIGSEPGLASEVRRSGGDGARCLQLDHQAGSPLPLARARNLGGAASATADLVFLDVDCVPERGLVGSYVDALRAAPHALVCGPVRYLVEDWDVGIDGSDVAIADAMLSSRSQPHPVRPVAPASGVRFGDDHHLFWSLSFAVRRRTWEQLSGFDSGYEGYGAEDTDLALRAKALGVPMAWSSGGTAYHQWHAGAARSPSDRGDRRQRPPLPGAMGVVADGRLAERACRSRARPVRAAGQQGRTGATTSRSRCDRFVCVTTGVPFPDGCGNRRSSRRCAPRRR